jgi:hypothetical protein
MKINPVILGCAGLLICAGFYFTLFPMIPAQSSGQKEPGTKLTTYDTPLGSLSINTELPQLPSSITLYRVVPAENDTIFTIKGNFLKRRPNVTSVADAPRAAQAALIPYGGLPQGAKLVSAKTEYIEEFDTKTDEITAKFPTTTNVHYARFIDGMPVVGDGGYIYLDLGDKGEIIYLTKVWRTVTPAGNVSIIPVSEAIEKMKRGELLGDKPKCACPLNVDKIGLGYYEKGHDETQEYLEPVWIFSGNLSSGDPWNYYVYARESADPTNATAPSAGQMVIPTVSEIPSGHRAVELPETSNLANTTANAGNNSG